MASSYRVPAVLAACLVSVATGCGQPGRVKGLVTLDGKPLPTGVITFNAAESGAAAYGAIGPDGRYELRTGAAAGLGLGDYVVTVAANAAASEQAPALETSAGRDEEDGDGGPQPTLPLMTPQKYADRDRTPLRATVKWGEQVLDFALVSEGEAAGAVSVP